MIQKLPDDFDWGSLSHPTSSEFISKEIFDSKIYDFWVEVKEGDIVVDVGSSVGPFAYKSLTKNPKKVYCIEPSKGLIQTNIKNNSRFFINQKTNPITFINAAISDEDKSTVKVFDTHDSFVENLDDFQVISFQDFIVDYDIGKIDFLKIDCEGGEYSILNEKNLDFIKNKVKFLACEIHAKNIENGMEKFLNLKNNFLSNFSRENYKIMAFLDWADYSIPSSTPIWHFNDVTDYIFTKEGMNYILPYIEVMLYIKNEL